ncbi:hypothetical protein GCM10010837_51370 [Aminobacter niigataensis]
MVAGQFRHSGAFHDTSNTLDLLGLLRQLGIALELLAEIARIGAAEPRLERLADIPRFLERGFSFGCRAKLSDPAIALLRVLAGKGAQIDTTTASGRMVFGIFATLAEFERDLIWERTMAGLAAARARGRKGGRKFALTKAQVRLAQAAMAQRDTSVSDLCKELGIERVTLYRYVGPKGELRDYGKRVLGLA